MILKIFISLNKNSEFLKNVPILISIHKNVWAIDGESYVKEGKSFKHKENTKENQFFFLFT